MGDLFVATGKNKLRIIPLGGLQEIGKNITAFEYDNEIIVVDCGIAFPEDDMLGIDLVIPDVSYLVKNSKRVKGIILTHGHEDHIGALPYVLKDLKVPVYGTRLTLALVEHKLNEHKMLEQTKLKRVKAGTTITVGKFKIEFINTVHSIADSVALAIRTPIGVVIHTSDFKLDYAPIEGRPMDVGRFAELGKQGVLALLSDSTNAERPGYSLGERTIGDTLEEFFSQTKSRIIVATFASNIHRIQQVINAAIKHRRKVALCGRSMVNVVSVASKLGYINMPDDILVDIDRIKAYKPSQIVLITTGSQGEPMSALYRMALSDHKKVTIVEGDQVLISASPIPGNEKLVSKVINELLKKGADVIYEAMADVHVSGHACQEELKLMLSIVKPKYFIPVHGEYRHLKHHARLASSLAIKEKDIFIMDNGNILEITPEAAKIAGNVTAGKVLVDGLGVGDVGSIVLRDRKHLAEDGLMVVVITLESATGKLIAGPDIISRGFVYVRESEKLIEDAKTVVKHALDKCQKNKVTDWSAIKSLIRDSLKQYLYEQTKRNPMILTIIMEV